MENGGEDDAHQVLLEVEVAMAVTRDGQGVCFAFTAEDVDIAYVRQKALGVGPCLLGPERERGK